MTDRAETGRDRAYMPWALIVGGCVVVFVLSAVRCAPEQLNPWWSMAWSMDCPAALRGVGAAQLAELWHGRGWWRVVTTGFVHGSAMHLALNGWSLLIVGPWASRAWGHPAALACFLVSSIGGVLASVVWAEAPIVVGASAGILGLAGGLWVSRAWGRPAVQRRVEPVSVRGLGGTLVALLGLGAVVPMIAQAGHVGGVVVGVGFGLGLGSARRAVQLTAGAGVVLGLVLLGFGAAAPRGRANYFVFLGFDALETGHVEKASRYLEQGLAANDDPPPELENAVAYAFAEAGVRLGEAERLVDSALEQEPDNPDFLDTKGWVLCKRGDVEAGLAWVQRASEASGGAVPEIEEHLATCSAAKP